MKKSILFCVMLLIFSCKEKSKTPIADVNSSQTQVLVVKYELQEMSLESHAQLGSDVVANFAPGKIKGLIGKTFIGNLEKGVFGGVYYFTDQVSLEAYLASELWEGIVAHPNLINFKTTTFSVASISDTSNGIAEKRKMATEEGDDIAKHLLVVNYELQEMSLIEHAQLGSDVVANFAPGKIKGLVGKTFIGNIEKGVFGGIYYFTDQDSLEAYLNSELWKGIVAHPNLVSFKTEIYMIAPISTISNGIPML
tara:strand:- start:8431 stop:9186 length:756 start_codon:yes stop_codon:yes gene_type:complete